MKQLPPVDYDKIATYRWKVWTKAGEWWGQVQDVGPPGLPGDFEGRAGPFATEADAHRWVLSYERTAERTNERKE